MSNTVNRKDFIKGCLAFWSHSAAQPTRVRQSIDLGSIHTYARPFFDPSRRIRFFSIAIRAAAYQMIQVGWRIEVEWRCFIRKRKTTRIYLLEVFLALLIQHFLQDRKEPSWSSQRLLADSHIFGHSSFRVLIHGSISNICLYFLLINMFNCLFHYYIISTSFFFCSFAFQKTRPSRPTMGPWAI